MCMCVSVYTYIKKCIHTCATMYTYSLNRTTTDTHANTQMHTHIHSRTTTRTDIQLHIYTYIHTPTNSFTYVYILMFIHTNTQKYAHLHTRKHTHSHPRTHTHAQGAHVWKHWDGDSPMDALKEFNALDTGMCASLSLYIRKTINVYIYFCFFPLTGVLDTCRRRGRGVTSTVPSVLCCLTPSAQIFFGRTVLHIFLLVGI